MNVSNEVSFQRLRDFQRSPGQTERSLEGPTFADRLVPADGITNVSITYGTAEGSRAEILEKFPGLTEEKLDHLLYDYDIGSMDSEQLFKLAEELMEEGVIPARPSANGLNEIAVFPKALYDAFLRGEIPQPGGVVKEMSGFVCMTDLSAGGQDSFTPKYGLERLRYESQMLEDAFKRFGQYYTSDELKRHTELSNSRTEFLELAELLVAYKEQPAVRNRLQAEAAKAEQSRAEAAKAGEPEALAVETAGSGKDMVKTTMLDGRRIYLVDREVVEAHGHPVELSYFAKVAETWKEGEKRDSLSAEELDALKQKYNSDTMTRKECIDLLGDLVEAGFMTASEAKNIYSGLIPIDLNLNGALQKWTPGAENVRNRWNRISGGLEASDDLNWKMGYEYFDAWYDLAKISTTVNDPDKDWIFGSYKRFMGVLDELRA